MTTENLSSLNPFSKLAGKPDQTSAKAANKAISAAEAFENHKSNRQFARHLDDSIEKAAPPRHDRRNGEADARQASRDQRDHHDNRADRDAANNEPPRASKRRDTPHGHTRTDHAHPAERHESSADHSEKAAPAREARDNPSEAANAEKRADDTTPPANTNKTKHDGDDQAHTAPDAKPTDAELSKAPEADASATEPVADAAIATPPADQATTPDAAAPQITAEVKTDDGTPLINNGDNAEQAAIAAQTPVITPAAPRAQAVSATPATPGDTPESSLTTHAGDISGDAPVITPAGDKTGKANQPETAGDPAQAAKDTAVNKDAAETLANQNPAAKSPAQAAILARHTAGNTFANSTFSNNLGAAKADAPLLQAADGGDGTVSLTNAIDSKAATPASQLRAAGYTSPTQSIALQIAQKVQSGTQQFEVRMNPPELGRVDVRLEFTRDGQVYTHLIVERPETLEMLSKDSRQLERALQQAGVTLDSDGLSFSLKDQGAAGDRQQAKSLFNEDSNAAADAELTETDQANIIYRRIAPPNGIDISI